MRRDEGATAQEKGSGTGNRDANDGSSIYSWGEMKAGRQIDIYLFQMKCSGEKC